MGEHGRQRIELVKTKLDMKYIDTEKLKEECKKVTEKILLELGQYPYMRMIVLRYYEYIDKVIDTLQQEQDFIVINKKDSLNP